MLCCVVFRVEPKAQSDTFVVHGQACRVSDAHPTCTHNKPGQMPGGRIYTIDITDLMGDDLQVTAVLNSVSVTIPVSIPVSVSGSASISISVYPTARSPT